MVEMKRPLLTANYFRDPRKANTTTEGGKIPPEWRDCDFQTPKERETGLEPATLSLGS